MNGFEGVYINENIMGIVKYLKTLSLDKGEVENDQKLRLEMAQDVNLGFAYQQKIARMLLGSHYIDKANEKDSAATYELINKDKTKIKQILDYESFNSEKKKYEDELKNIKSTSDKNKNLVELYEISFRYNLNKEELKKEDLTKINLILRNNSIKLTLDDKNFAQLYQQMMDKINAILDKEENKDTIKKISELINKISEYNQKIERIKASLKIDEAVYGAIDKYPDRILSVFFDKDYRKTENLFDRLFNPGFIFRKKSDTENYLDINFNRINSGYQADRLFAYDNPIIKDILSPYVDEVNGNILVSDYKVFYLFANYGSNKKEIGQLKCANQNELLLTTKNFIQSITK
jgi:hypothetical protein